MSNSKLILPGGLALPKSAASEPVEIPRDEPDAVGLVEMAGRGLHHAFRELTELTELSEEKEAREAILDALATLADVQAYISEAQRLIVDNLRSAD